MIDMYTAVRGGLSTRGTDTAAARRPRNHHPVLRTMFRAQTRRQSVRTEAQVRSHTRNQSSADSLMAAGTPWPPSNSSYVTS